MNEEQIQKIIDEVESRFPYKEPGNRDTYRQYNEGWSDACHILSQEIIEALQSTPQMDENIIMDKEKIIEIIRNNIAFGGTANGSNVYIKMEKMAEEIEQLYQSSLPSDEEIDEKAKSYSKSYIGVHFKEGAKWMKQQITK